MSKGKLIARAFALPPRELLWVVSCWMHYFVWHIVIWLVPYRYWRKHVFSPLAPRRTSQLPIALPRAVSLCEKAARHHIFHINCLRRCVVQRRLLMKYGVSSTLHFGVAKQHGQLKAHCWLTHNGKLLNDGPEVVNTYTELTMDARQQESMIAGMR